MMRIFPKRIGSALMLMIIPSFVLAGQPAQFALNGQSSFEERTTGIHLVNVTYEVRSIDLGTDHRSEHVVFEQRRESDQRWESDADTGTVTVTAKVLTKDLFSKPLWSFKESATDAQIEWPFYRSTITNDDGDTEPLYRYRSLSTGRTLFIATTQPALAQWHQRGSDESYTLAFSYVSDRTLQDFAFKRRHPDAFGLIVMQLGDKVFDRLVLIGKLENRNMEGWSPRLFLLDPKDADETAPDGRRELTLLHRNGPLSDKVWDAFELRLRFKDDTGRPTIGIPVRNGHFDLTGTTLPKGVSAQHDMQESQTTPK